MYAQDEFQGNMMLKLIIHLQPHDRSQQTDGDEAIAPMPELSQLELLTIAGAGARRRFGDMF